MNPRRGTELLQQILEGDTLSSSQLAAAGVHWPQKRSDRNPHLIDGGPTGAQTVLSEDR